MRCLRKNDDNEMLIFFKYTFLSLIYVLNDVN